MFFLTQPRFTLGMCYVQQWTSLFRSTNIVYIGMLELVIHQSNKTVNNTLQQCDVLPYINCKKNKDMKWNSKVCKSIKPSWAIILCMRFVFYILSDFAHSWHNRASFPKGKIRSHCQMLFTLVTKRHLSTISCW